MVIAALVARANARGMAFVKEFGVITTRVSMVVKAETNAERATIVCRRKPVTLRAVRRVLFLAVQPVKPVITQPAAAPMMALALRVGHVSRAWIVQTMDFV